MHIHVIKIQITFLTVDKLPDSGEKSAKYIKKTKYILASCSSPIFLHLRSFSSKFSILIEITYFLTTLT